MALSRFFRATAPDPFVIAILLTGATYLLALAFTDRPAGALLDDWQAGLWGLLAFGMQMCLVLVTGHALAASPPVARAVRALAGLPRSERQAVLLTAAVAMGAALVNWGFGLIVGAILAREAERAARARGLSPSRGLLAAAGYTGLLVWHGGLSGSAPLTAADEAGQVRILGEELAAKVGAIPLSESVFGAMNLVGTGGLVLVTLGTLALLCPKRGASGEPIEGPRDDAPDVTVEVESAEAGAGAVPRWLERSFLVPLVVAAPALAWLGVRFWEAGLDALTLNTAILLFFALGLTLSGSAHRYGRAVEEGARGCAGIMVQFPLYAGIMGMMTASGLAASVSRGFVGAAGGSEAGLSLVTLASAGLVNLFVPSGGGQWAVQGPIALGAAVESGADPAKVLMAVAYGDQLTNMLQPFWALPLLAITRARAGEVVGYTAVVMVVGALWLGGVLLLV